MNCIKSKKQISKNKDKYSICPECRHRGYWSKQILYSMTYKCDYCGHYESRKMTLPHMY